MSPSSESSSPRVVGGCRTQQMIRTAEIHYGFQTGLSYRAEGNGLHRNLHCYQFSSVYRVLKQVKDIERHRLLQNQITLEHTLKKAQHSIEKILHNLFAHFKAFYNFLAYSLHHFQDRNP